MKCPHCRTEYHSGKATQYLSEDDWFFWSARHEQCPSCRKVIIELYGESKLGGAECCYEALAYPRTISRAPLSPVVPGEFAQDYREACLVLNDSPKASAALSRRCLQHVLREKAGIRPKNLYDEIQQVLDSGQLPSHLAGAVDAVRNIGNFAAHTTKSTSTGEIVDVEPEEAEWQLDTLEGLFDFYFVQPAQLKAKKDALNQKLKDAGKPGIK